jgi:hypothetical protein
VTHGEQRRSAAPELVVLALHLDPPEEAEREEPGNDGDDPIERSARSTRSMKSAAS